MTSTSRRFEGYFADNRRLWDIRTHAHVQPGVYGIEEALDGKITLSALEVDEVGPVDGKDLLHLQCHFGMGTISWARLGANATGVDFSPAAAETARDLARRCDVPAEFVEANVYDVPGIVNKRFDVVFTSYGVLWWLPDLREWAKVIHTMLKPGGVFYIAEIHPVAQTFREAGNGIRVGDDYFGRDIPASFEVSSTYADPAIELESATEHGWQHSLGEVVTALLDAGLRLEYLREHPFSCYRMLPTFEQHPDGRWYPPSGTPSMPLLFSIRAHRPEHGRE